MIISRTNTALSLVALVSVFSLMGCQNTAEGVAQDTTKNTEAVKETASEAGQAAAKTASDAGQAAAQVANDAGKAAAEAGKEAAGATVVTPLIKTALAADPDINDTKNLIDVDTADGMVHLKGHVINNTLKARATQIAEKTIKEHNRTDKVMNQLIVKP